MEIRLFFVKIQVCVVERYKNTRLNLSGGENYILCGAAKARKNGKSRYPKRYRLFMFGDD